MNHSDYWSRWVVFAFGAVAVLAVLLTATVRPMRFEPSFLAFLALALLLERSSSELHFRVRGSAAFLIVCALAVVSGPIAACIATAIGVVVAGVSHRRPALKLCFNAFQHVLAVCFGWWTYTLLGGLTPAAFLLGPTDHTWFAATLDLLRFCLLVLAFLVFTTLSVSVVVSVSERLNFMQVWSRNNRGVLAFDFSSIAVSILGAVSFTFFNQWPGFGVVGLALVAVPMMVSRKSYILLRQLQASGEELLQLMVKAIEARDPYTSGHSLRVQRMSVAIASDMGISGNALEEVATASLLHDVGKIHEEFAPLLRKEGKLDDAERTLIETHAERGAELVGVISRFRGVIQSAVLHHHERWDGKGYPHKLSGTSIPLISRIILVADTIDAMTTDRPYRARMGFDAVVAELRKHAGAQFDPQIAEAATSSLAVRRILVETDVGARLQTKREPEPLDQRAGE